MSSVNERLVSLRAAERSAYGARLERIRRQIAMLTEDERQKPPRPKQARRFA